MYLFCNLICVPTATVQEADESSHSRQVHSMDVQSADESLAILSNQTAAEQLPASISLTQSCSSAAEAAPDYSASSGDLQAPPMPPPQSIELIVQVEDEVENDYTIMVPVDIVTPSSSRRRINVADISPLPRAAILGPRKRKTQRATVLTTSPYKSQLEEARRLKDEEVNEKRQRKNKLAVAGKKAKNGPKCAKQVDNSKGLYTDEETGTMPKINSSRRSKRKNATAKLAKTSDACDRRSQQYFCIYCTKQYIEPPTEDWIRCEKCLEWAHISCAPTDDDTFVCDYCL
jgi:hypothetical protein